MVVVALIAVSVVAVVDRVETLRWVRLEPLPSNPSQTCSSNPQLDERPIEDGTTHKRGGSKTHDEREIHRVTGGLTSTRGKPSEYSMQ